MGGNWAVSGQDKLLISLLSPERLLEMTRFFTLFDKKTGKNCCPLSAGVRDKKTAGTHQYPQTRRGQGRWGDLAYHGSGKSYTMVFLSKALILHDSLKQCRIVVVTDRVDLKGKGR